MPNKETLREPVAAVPDAAHISAKAADGWRLVALEWERDAAAAQPKAQSWSEDIPYGLRASDDTATLVENPAEIQSIILALDMIVDDLPLSQIAAEMNSRGHRMRNGQPWTPTALFTLLPRMIEMSPRLFSADKWVKRRQTLQRVV
jgi:hypothetical protein